MPKSDYQSQLNLIHNLLQAQLVQFYQAHKIQRDKYTADQWALKGWMSWIYMMIGKDDELHIL